MATARLELGSSRATGGPPTSLLWGRARLLDPPEAWLMSPGPELPWLSQEEAPAERESPQTPSEPSCVCGGHGGSSGAAEVAVLFTLVRCQSQFKAGGWTFLGWFQVLGWLGALPTPEHRQACRARSGGYSKASRLWVPDVNTVMGSDGKCCPLRRRQSLRGWQQSVLGCAGLCTRGGG